MKRCSRVRQLLAAAGNARQLRRFIARKPPISIDVCTDTGRTALHMALLERNLAAVKNLLDAGADVRAGKSGGLNTFMVAVVSNLPSVAAQILKLDPQFLDEPNPDGAYPLEYAVKAGALFAVESLIQLGVNLDRRYKECSALHLAVHRRHIKIVKALFMTGKFDLTLRGPDNFTPLLAAVASQNVPMVGYLLDEGKCDVTERTSSGLSVLTSACATGNVELAELLLKHGASAYYRNPSGAYPVDTAIVSGHCDVVELMHKVRPLNLTSLELAVHYKDGKTPSKMLKLLLRLIKPSRDTRTHLAQLATPRLAKLLVRPCGAPECDKWGKRACTRCKKTYYCSVECQTIGWNEGHREECPRP